MGSKISVNVSKCFDLDSLIQSDSIHRRYRQKTTGSVRNYGQCICTMLHISALTYL